MGAQMAQQLQQTALHGPPMPGGERIALGACRHRRTSPGLNTIEPNAITGLGVMEPPFARPRDSGAKRRKDARRSG